MLSSSPCATFRQELSIACREIGNQQKKTYGWRQVDWSWTLVKEKGVNERIERGTGSYVQVDKQVGKQTDSLTRNSKQAHKKDLADRKKWDGNKTNWERRAIAHLQGANPLPRANKFGGFVTNTNESLLNISMRGQRLQRCHYALPQQPRGQCLQRTVCAAPVLIVQTVLPCATKEEENEGINSRVNNRLDSFCSAVINGVKRKKQRGNHS